MHEERNGRPGRRYDAMTQQNQSPVVTDEELEAMVRAHDREDAAQKGEPDPWHDDFPEPFKGERLAAMRCAVEALIQPSGKVSDEQVERAEDRAAPEAAQLPARPVVKALEWRNAHSRLIMGIGQISNSEYVLDGEHVGVNWVVMSGDRVRGDYIGGFATIHEAKAAAQADYEHRILSAIEPAQAQGEVRRMTGFLDTLTKDQLKAAMEYRGEDNHPAPEPAELEVVGWAYRGPRGGLIVTEERPSHAPEARAVTDLTDAQAAIAALRAERERLDEECRQSMTTIAQERERAEAAEARVAELEKALTPFAQVAKHDIGHTESDSDFYRPMNPKYAVAGVPRVAWFREALRALHPEREGE